MDLRDIVQNYLTDNEKGMQQLITWFLNDVMNEEVAQQAGVPRYARSSSRRAHRNGYRPRSLKTRFGELSLQKPQLREIPFETKVFERYSRTEKALVNTIIESYLQGVTVDAVDIPRVNGSSDHVLTFLPRSGDPFYFKGQQTSGVKGIQTTLKLLTPDGASFYPVTSSLKGNPYGQQCYSYPNNSGSGTECNYDVSSTIPPANIRPMHTGRWTIQLIDEELHVVAGHL
jgi:hypothetical protein